MKKKPTKAESDHMGTVAGLGCIICKMPAHVHHLPVQGGQKDNFKVIPLCPLHHQHGNIGVAVHSGRRSFERNFGTELELLKKVNKLLGNG